MSFFDQLMSRGDADSQHELATKEIESETFADHTIQNKHKQGTDRYKGNTDPSTRLNTDRADQHSSSTFLPPVSSMSFLPAFLQSNSRTLSPSANAASDVIQHATTGITSSPLPPTSSPSRARFSSAAHGSQSIASLSSGSGSPSRRHTHSPYGLASTAGNGPMTSSAPISSLSSLSSPSSSIPSSYNLLSSPLSSSPLRSRTAHHSTLGHDTSRPAASVEANKHHLTRPEISSPSLVPRHDYIPTTHSFRHAHQLKASPSPPLHASPSPQPLSLESLPLASTTGGLTNASSSHLPLPLAPHLVAPSLLRSGSLVPIVPPPSFVPVSPPPFTSPYKSILKRANSQETGVNDVAHAGVTVPASSVVSTSAAMAVEDENTARRLPFTEPATAAVADSQVSNSESDPSSSQISAEAVEEERRTRPQRSLRNRNKAGESKEEVDQHKKNTSRKVINAPSVNESKHIPSAEPVAPVHTTSRSSQPLTPSSSPRRALHPLHHHHHPQTEPGPIRHIKHSVRFDMAEVHEFNLIPDASKVPGDEGDYAIGMERIPHTSYVASLDVYESIRAKLRKPQGPDSIDEEERRRIWIQAQREAEQLSMEQKRKSGIKILPASQERALLQSIGRHLDDKQRSRKRKREEEEEEETTEDEEDEEEEDDEEDEHDHSEKMTDVTVAASADIPQVESKHDTESTTSRHHAATNVQTSPPKKQPQQDHPSHDDSSPQHQHNLRHSHHTHSASTGSSTTAASSSTASNNSSTSRRHSRAVVVAEPARPPSPSSACFRLIPHKSVAFYKHEWEEIEFMDEEEEEDDYAEEEEEEQEEATAVDEAREGYQSDVTEDRRDAHRISQTDASNESVVVKAVNHVKRTLAPLATLSRSHSTPLSIRFNKQSPHAQRRAASATPPPPSAITAPTSPSSDPILLFSDHADLEWIRTSRRQAGCNCKGSKKVKVCGAIAEMKHDAETREAKRASVRGATAGLRQSSTARDADQHDEEDTAAMEICPCVASGVGCNSNICRCASYCCVNKEERYIFNQQKVNNIRRKILKALQD